MSDMPAGSYHYKVTLRFRRRTLTTYFSCGPAIDHEPTAADVLSCLCSDANAGAQDFDGFCSDFGYDTDSRKAEKAWRACQKMADRLPVFLGDDFDEFCNAEH